MRFTILLLMAAAVGIAQGATPEFPQKRVLTAEGVQSIGKVPVVLVETNRGIEKTWFDKTNRRGGYTPTPSSGDPVADLAGVIIAAGILEAFKDRGPHSNAQTAADQIVEKVPPSFIQASLLKHVEDAKSGEPIAQGISLGDVSIVQKLPQSKPIDDVLEIEASYSLADDGSAFRALFVASYSSSKLAYVAPHDFKGKPPKSERQGPLYRNVFSYRSNRLPVPPNNSEFRVLLAEAIRDNYRDAGGALPAADSQEGKAMAEEIEAAEQTRHTNEDISTILTRRWLADDASLLRQEVANAHAFLVRYLLPDLNSTTVPTLHGDTERLEYIPGERIVRRVNSGVSSGTYESLPDVASDPTQTASFGNATAISKLQERRIQQLKQQGRKTD